MRRYEVGYFFQEGVRGIFLHGFMSFAAVGVIAACLLIMGSVSLLAVNIDITIKEIQSQNEILVIIEESYSEAEANSVGTRISRIDNVADRVFVSKDAALEEFGRKLNNNFLLEGYEDEDMNPIRHRFVVQLRDVSQMRETIRELEDLTGVAAVNAEVGITDFILSIRSVVNAVSLSLIAMLLGVSVFIISNTVKLATFDRREEIGIMRIVGATNTFIRWPFVVEGFLLGLMGALLAFFVQWTVYNYMSVRVTGVIPIFSLAPFGDILIFVLPVFLLFGFVVGVLGSVLTIRRFLRV